MATRIVGGTAEKALSVDQFFDYMADFESSEDVRAQYANVAWVYRCVELRSNALARIPYKVFVGESEDEFEGWSLDLHRYLLITEADLLLSGAGYWLKIADNMMLHDIQRLNPWTMTVLTEPDSQNGLTQAVDGIFGFRQETRGQVRYYPPERMVYFDQLYNPKDDLGPGVAPAEVSLIPSRLVANMNEWAAQFFEHGAVPLTVLQTDSTILEAEQKRIKAVWDKVFAGVRNAWRTVVLQKGLKAEVLGESIKDLAMPDLDERVKEQIAAAYGVPMSLLTQGNVNRATAEIHWQSFYTDTIIPSAEQHQNVINDELMNPLSLRLEFQYNEVEAVQRQEQQKASATSQIMREVNNSVSAGTLYEPEARALMDLLFQQMGLPALEQLVPPAELDAFMREKEERRQEMAQQLQQKPEEPPPEEGESPKAFGAAPPAVWSELALWKRTGRKNFDSEVLPDWLTGLIKASIQEVGPEQAFMFLKQDRGPIEAETEEAVAAVLSRFEKKARQAAKEGGGFDFYAFEAALSAALLPKLQTIATNRVMEIATEVGVQFDPAFINDRALEWARAYTYDLVSGLTQTTRDGLSKAISAYIENPGMTNKELAALIEPMFGAARAEMIGVTEVTRAYAEATNFYQSEIVEAGVEMVRVWNTAMDDRVCPICGPLDGAPEEVWARQFPDGPPAHPRCRCEVGLSARPRRELMANHRERQRQRDAMLEELA